MLNPLFPKYLLAGRMVVTVLYLGWLSLTGCGGGGVPEGELRSTVSPDRQFGERQVGEREPLGPSPSGLEWGTEETQRQVSTLRGNIQIDGSSTVRPIGEAVAMRFGRLYPRVRVDVGGRGTGNGLKRFQARELDFVHTSRPILPNEAAGLAEAGLPFLELPVAYDGVTVVVHPHNRWVQQLSLEQLRRLFLHSSGTRTWRDVDPNWPNQTLKVFAPGTGSGTYDFFADVLGGPLRSGMSLNEDDNALVTGVSGNLYSIGFFGVAYYNENRGKLRAIPIVNPETGQAYLPERLAIEENLYAPLSRPLFLYVNQQSLSRVEVRQFLRFYIATVPELASKVGFVKLPEEIWQAVEAAVEQPEQHLGSRLLDRHGQTIPGRFEDVYLQSPTALLPVELPLPATDNPAAMELAGEQQP
jgi:phosphate transport system substrate-binding protein